MSMPPTPAEYVALIYTVKESIRAKIEAGSIAMEDLNDFDLCRHKMHLGKLRPTAAQLRCAVREIKAEVKGKGQPA